jgi:hypothetical protein
MPLFCLLWQAFTRPGPAHAGGQQQAGPGTKGTSCEYDSLESTPPRGNSPWLQDTDDGQYVIQGFGLDLGALARPGRQDRTC